MKYPQVAALLAIALPHFCPAQTAPARFTFPKDESVLDAQRDFGAKGDGVSDDTDAIQSAIERCNGPEGSRFFYLPKGIYKVTKPIIFKPPGKENNWGGMVGPWIYGQDRDTTIIRSGSASTEQSLG